MLETLPTSHQSPNTPMHTPDRPRGWCGGWLSHFKSFIAAGSGGFVRGSCGGRKGNEEASLHAVNITPKISFEFDWPITEVNRDAWTLGSIPNQEQPLQAKGIASPQSVPVCWTTLPNAKCQEGHQWPLHPDWHITFLNMV